MILLRALGTCDLIATDRPTASAVVAQPKRFALLTYLAVAGDHGFVRRDTLLALFWPETDQARGRNALRQTIFQLRQALGSGVITSRGDEELGVDPAEIECDVGLFDRALAAGKPAEALAHYRGDFLAGFHVPDAASEVEDWIQAERQRLRALATNGAWALAEAEESAGNKAGAAAWARRSLELDWLSESRVSVVMQLLTRVGDRAGARRAYHEHARRLQEDLGESPGLSLRHLLESVQTSTTPLVQSATTQVPPETVAPARTDASQQQARPRSRRAALILLPIAIAVITGALFLRGIGARLRTPVIAVGQIRSAAPGDSASNVPADLLSTSLARVSGVQVIPLTRLYDVQSQLRAARRPETSTLAAAAHAGAEEVIQGTVHEDRSHGVSLDLQVIDAKTGRVRRALRVKGADIFAAVDDATQQLASAYGARSPSQPIAKITTSSIVAYRLYDQGLRTYYGGDARGAYRLFTEALAEDSSFAMAAFYAGWCAAMTGRAEAYPLFERAAALADRAPDRERLLIRQRVAELTMSPQSGAYADTMVVRYPGDPDAHYGYARLVLLRRGDFLGAAREFRRLIELDSLSLTQAARCFACEVYGQLWWAYLQADSMPAGERVAREFASLRPGLTSYGQLAMSLLRLDRIAEARAVYRAMDTLNVAGNDRLLNAARIEIRAGDFPALERQLRPFLVEGSAAQRLDAAFYLVLSLRNQGRLQEAMRLTPLLDSHLTRSILLFEMQRAREAAAEFARQLPAPQFDRSPGHQARHKAWLWTHVATSLASTGDTAGLAALADSVERVGQQSAFGRDVRLHHYIRGLLWKVRGDQARAADEFRASIWSWTEGYTRANYELARSLLALGRPAEAVYPLQSALRGDIDASNLYITRTELHELLAAAFDSNAQPDSALVHYRQVVRAWRNADPQFAKGLRAARLRVRALETHGRESSR